MFLWWQVPQDVLQKLLETLQENHYQEDEQFLGAVMPRLGNNVIHMTRDNKLLKSNYVIMLINNSSSGDSH